MIEEIAPHQDFKTRKQIRYEKYGINEDEDAILNQKIHMPRRKQHEIFESVDDLSERHKVPPLRSKKARIFEKLLGFARSHSFVERGSLSLSCATLPQPSCFSKSIIKRI